MSVMTETTVIDGNSLIHVVHENKINASKYTSFSKAVKTKTVQNI